MKIGRLSAALLVSVAVSSAYAGTTVRFDDDWRFTVGDPSGAQEAQFNDTAWTSVELPHDWSIAGPIAQNNPTRNAGGYFPAGVGWYRKTFKLPSDSAGKRFVLDLISRNSDRSIYCVS